MKITLVTKEPSKFDLASIETVQSIAEVKDIGYDDVLILNSYEETEYKAGIILAEMIQKGLRYLMYLNDEPKLNMSSLIASVGGIVDTEDYLADIETLEYIIGNYTDNNVDTTDLTVSGADDLVNNKSVEILSTFYKDFVSGKADVANEAYLELVETAINDITQSTTTLKDYSEDVKTTVNMLYRKASEELDGLQNRKTKIEDELVNIKSLYEDLESNTKSIVNVDTFASYKHVKQSGTKVIIFKEYSQTRYLTSFVMGYMEHLSNIMHKRVRLLILIPNRDTYLNKYRMMPTQPYHISGDNYESEDSINSDVYYTALPLKRIYQHLLNALSDDYLIVLDRGYHDKPAITGNTKIWHCFSGKTEANMYKNVNKNKIFSIVGLQSTDIIINHIENYPVSEVNRRAIYSKLFKEKYKELDKVNGVKLN